MIVSGVLRSVADSEVSGGRGVAAGLSSSSTCPQVRALAGRSDGAVSGVVVRAARRTAATRTRARASSRADAASAAGLRALFGSARVWVPTIRVTLCDLRVFVDEAAEAVAPEDAGLGVCGGWFGCAEVFGAALFQ